MEHMKAQIELLNKENDKLSKENQKYRMGLGTYVYMYSLTVI